MYVISLNILISADAVVLDVFAHFFAFFIGEADTIPTDSVPTDAIPTVHSHDDPVHL